MATTPVRLLAAALLLAACEPMTPANPPPSGAPAPAPSPVAHVPLALVPRSPLTRETAAYYARIQANFVAQGLLRTDTGAVDAPYTQRQVVDNFMQIAFYDEYRDRGGQLVAEPIATPLHRWERPVTMRIEAGPSVPPEQVARDRTAIAAYAARLARVTRHPVSLGGPGGNFTILILTEDERRAYAGRLKVLMPGMNAATLDAIVNMEPSTYCSVVNRDQAGTDTYVQAIAIIRAEHPDLLRLSCLHEELAQGLGLANDSPAARPSIFNDDEEFALLTRMDEILLQILYDPRLRPGMSEAEARPVVETITAEIMGGTG